MTYNDDKKLKIGEAAEFLGVTVQTLRNWDKSGKLPTQKSEGGHRYYFQKNLERFIVDLSSLGLAWASSAQPPQIPQEYYCERQDRFTSRLEKMAIQLLHDGAVGRDMASLLTAVSGEIGDNSFMHNVGNWPDAQGIFFAYDIGKRIIVLADRGQGVRATLLRVRPQIATDTEALRIAFTEIVSGRAPEKRGNGLKVVRRIVERGDIALLFRSGVGRIRYPQKSSSLIVETAGDNIRGTYAVITF